ncbi:MAG: hypothetical protein KJ069_01375 [Anaerolineae bacterium]|nr:hypothetical protein [Anaerolineae bacterium]
MNRIPSILFPAGLALLCAGGLFMLLGLTPRPQAAQALPDNHPPLPDNYTGAALVPSTLADFFAPGTQPGHVTDTITAPFICSHCHSNYSEKVPQPAEYEPWTGWQGSMMAQAGRDPVFYAALDIAMADAQFSGEFCLRCHLPRAWLEGRIVSGTLAVDPMENPIDLEGVQCEVCHRMSDPTPDESNDPRDLYVLTATITTTIPISDGNATMVFDPEDYRRGPFDVVGDIGFNPHEINGAETIQSRYHQESAFCGTCHDISNPLLSWNEISQTYALNPLGQPFTDTSKMFPIERTFSEWRLSQYNTPEGVYAPEFGGNKTYVVTCQDCHMRDVTGVGGSYFGDPNGMPVREDMPLHDLTGANTWVPQIIPLHPVFSATFQAEPARVEALNLGIERARYMLQNAAVVTAVHSTDTNELTVRVTNNSGHKLPTGYVEGRRMWLQVEGYDAEGNLVYTSGAYDPATGDLTLDADIQVYESKHGLTPDLAAQLGLPSGESFHFALNNIIVKDNRIPPRGFDYAAFATVGAEPRTNGQPDPTRYADGQYWDEVVYALPEGVVYGRVRLLYQTSSKEYIEFLRDNNPNVGNPNNNGQILYSLWEATGRSTPEVMGIVSFGEQSLVYLPVVMRNP